MKPNTSLTVFCIRSCAELTVQVLQVLTPSLNPWILVLSLFVCFTFSRTLLFTCLTILSAGLFFLTLWCIFYITVSRFKKKKRRGFCYGRSLRCRCFCNTINTITFCLMNFERETDCNVRDNRNRHVSTTSNITVGTDCCGICDVIINHFMPQCFYGKIINFGMVWNQ